MPRDPIDDLLGTPDGEVSPFCPLEADVPKELALTLFRAMLADCSQQLERHLARYGPDGDLIGFTQQRRRRQQAIEALEWVVAQPGPSVRLGCYPFDLDAENAHFDQMLLENPELRDAGEEELVFPAPSEGIEELTRLTNEFLERMQQEQAEDDALAGEDDEADDGDAYDADRIWRPRPPRD